MKIETERLILYPISNEEIERLIEDEPAAEMKQAYSEMLQGCIQNPESRIWYTVWKIVCKDALDTAVGDFCFKGLGADGRLEVGYGLYDGYCGKGYMAETVKGIVKWASQQAGVMAIEAETEPNNLASQRVLVRAGFVPNGVMGEEGPRFVYQGTAK